MHVQIMTCPSLGYTDFDYIRMLKFYIREITLFSSIKKYQKDYIRWF